MNIREKRNILAFALLFFGLVSSCAADPARVSQEQKEPSWESTTAAASEIEDILFALLNQ
jgi:hypothetical protein